MTHVFPRVLDRELPEAVAAEGVWITAADGRRFLDGAGGAVVVNVGHGHRGVVAAIESQLARTQYVHGTMFTTGALEDYADEVASVLPIDDARIYPVSGGSEAVETALKLARAFHLARGERSRFVVIGRRGAYHGNTLGALDASGKEPLRKPYTPWLGRFLHAPPAYEYRCESTRHPHACGEWHAAELDRMIAQAQPASIAAFIAEPVAGATLGAAVPCEDYWSSVVEVCRRHGVLVIADEVMTGFGRTGKNFAYQHSPGVTPDLMVLGKGMVSAALPAGGLVMSREITAVMDRYRWETVATFAGNPIVSAAIAANVEWLIEERIADRAAVLGEHLGLRLRELQERHPCVARIDGAGLLWAVELVRPDGSGERFVAEDRHLIPTGTGGFSPSLFIAAECARQGVALATAPPNTLRLGPPLTTTSENIDLGIAGLDAALAALDRVGVPVAS